MTRWLVRFGYDGTGFAGWARQPGLRTVEGTLRDGLPRTGVVPADSSTRIAVASRTDRGVSARGNALTLSSSLAAPAVLRALNGIAPDIFFTAILAVPDGFRVRSPVQRWYRYFEPAAGHELDRWKAAAVRFRGNVDVRSFGRDLPSDRPVVRTVDSVRVRRSGSRWFLVDVRAPSFVWGMVRKIVAALRMVDAGTLPLPRLDAALRGEARLTLPLAAPEGLVLWDAIYPVAWAREWAGPNRAQSRYQRDVEQTSRLREVLCRQLWTDARPAGPPAET